jgi:hypothetical protein
MIVIQRGMGVAARFEYRNHIVRALYHRVPRRMICWVDRSNEREYFEGPAEEHRREDD